MFTFEYRFFPKSWLPPDIDGFDDSMQWFLSALTKNGQILSHYQNTVKLTDHYACRVVAPELDSLEDGYWNRYCRQFYAKVVQQSNQPPSLHLIGENYNTADCCTCSNPSHYILLIEYGEHTFPVLCGDCLSAVPLYKLPKTYDGTEYYDLLGWQQVYKGCDRLFTVGIGERFGYRMLHDPKSALSQEGMRFCRFWEEQTGKPFYYFLFQYYRKNRSVCPICGEPWVNQDTKHIHFDYACPHCRVVSNDVV